MIIRNLITDHAHTRFAALLGACMLFASTHDLHAQERSLTVLATGSASASATKVALQFSVSSQDLTATGLFVKQNDIVARLHKALETGGIKEEDITDEPFRLMPNMEYGQNGTRIIGYRLETPIDIQLENVKDLPRIIDLATSSGAGSVAVGAFSADGVSLHEQAMEHAIADARNQATAIAKQLGKTLGDIISVAQTEDAPKASGNSAEEEEERREGKGRKKQADQNTLTEKAEIKVVFELK